MTSSREKTAVNILSLPEGHKNPLDRESPMRTFKKLLLDQTIACAGDT